jgi:hypothetical protein
VKIFDMACFLSSRTDGRSSTNFARFDLLFMHAVGGLLVRLATGEDPRHDLLPAFVNRRSIVTQLLTFRFAVHACSRLTRFRRDARLKQYNASAFLDDARAVIAFTSVCSFEFLILIRSLSQPGSVDGDYFATAVGLPSFS